MQIEPGKLYWIDVDNVRFKVQAVRAAAVNGWWLCETESNRERVVVPESVLAPVDSDSST